MNKIKSKLYYAVGKIIEVIFSALIFIVDIFVDITNAAASLIRSILGLACIFILFSPFLLIFLFGTIFSTVGIIAIFVIGLLLLMRPLSRFLKKYKYALTSYFYEKSKAYEKNIEFSKTVSDYANEYDQQQRKRRQKKQKQRVEDIFEDLFGGAGRNSDYRDRRSRPGSSNSNYQNWGWWGGFGGPQGGYSGYQQRQNQTNPFGFRAEYEKNCDILGVPYTADYSEIKKAYRNLAKKYHPDISDEANAEEKFKKVTDAYEFFTEEKVEDYKKRSS